MSARENILTRVRQSIGRSAGTPPGEIPDVMLRVPGTSLSERVSQFCGALEKLAGQTYLASSPADAGSYVRSVIAGRPFLATNAQVLRQCGIESAELAPDRVEVGVTGADFGLADTGTLVVLSASEPRLTSLLPPVHIAIILRERLLANLDELWTVLPTPAEQTASLVLITGPSRTADIEQILVRGVHGPGELHVVLV